MESHPVKPRRIKLAPSHGTPICYQHGDYRVQMVTNGAREEIGKRYWTCPWPGCSSRACTPLEPLMIELDPDEIPDEGIGRQLRPCDWEK